MVITKHHVNTRYFREAAIAFKKNNGRYTLAPQGNKDWWDFWEEQEKRCLYGYSVGGVKITGRHYWYLNFCPMKRTDENDKGKRAALKDTNFPLFFEIDYDWFWYKEIAWTGCTQEQLNKLNLWRNPTDISGGKHLVCAKARRGGFSYKEAGDGTYNFNFIPASKSYYFAAIEGYLISDGILNKVQDDLEFLNQNTDFFWFKNRMEKNTLMHQKASYIDADGNKRGTKSEIIGVIINDPEKVRGKDGMKIVYEEAGSFPDLKRALAISVPSVTEGNIITGQISIFGTGGEEKGDYIEGLQEIFDDPKTFKMLPFKNDWEEGYEGTECGVFCPSYMINPGFMDLDGNIDIEGAIKYEDKERELKKGAKDPKEYDRRIAEFCKVPSEAFLRVTRSDFPLAEVLQQKNRILRSKEIQGLLQYGDLVHDPEKGLHFIPKPYELAKPIIKYPHSDTDDLSGCVTIAEHPQKVKNEVPKGVYLIVVDPYYKDDAQDTTSLGAAYVIKLKSIYFNNKTDHAVAWFVGRPDKVTTFHEIVLNLADYYNATIQSEIAGGGKGLYDTAVIKKKLHRLEFEPFLINNVEIQKTPKNRSYFMDISTDDKKNGLLYYANWLKTPVGLSENGHEIWNLHYEYDLGLLEEILKFRDDRNADRISSRIVLMFMLKEEAARKNKKQKEKKKSIIGTRPLFADVNTNLEGTFRDNFILRNDIM